MRSSRWWRSWKAVASLASKGIDVSSWQGAIDWEAVKASGIQFAIIRAGYGDELDNQFARNIAECNRLEIPCGVYWFSYALTAQEAAQEAQRAMAAVRPYKLDLPVCYDLEYDTVRYAARCGVTIDKTLATQMAVSFCDTVAAGGAHPANYTNLDYSRRMFDMDALREFDLWYAWYNDDCNIDDVAIWQYTSSGSLPGIAGNVDMDYCNKDYSVEPVPKSGTEERKETIEMELRMLRRGDSGNDVHAAMLLMADKGYYDGSCDNLFGPRMEQGLLQMQRDNGLGADGLLGKASWTYLLK